MAQKCESETLFDAIAELSRVVRRQPDPKASAAFVLGTMSGLCLQLGWTVDQVSRLFLVEPTSAGNKE